MRVASLFAVALVAALLVSSGCGTAQQAKPRRLSVAVAITPVGTQANRQRGQLERMGGKSYVMLSDLDEWFESLWHGRRLGYTIAFLSFVGFLLSRGLARVHDDHQRELMSEAESQPLLGKPFYPNPPNKALEPTSTSVTSPAAQEPRQP